MTDSSDPSDTAWTARDHAAMAREIGAARAVAEARALERLTELVGVVYRLRDEDGCPWDRKQTFASMARHLQEEAAESADAIAHDDGSPAATAHLAEELGDTLMNVLILARIGDDAGRFDLATVAAGISEKLVRRHPHVFGDGTAEDPDAALASWNASKAAEREGRPVSALDGVPGSLPALLAARQISSKAADVGFDWPEVSGALDKLHEEVGELTEAAAALEAGSAPRAADAETADIADSTPTAAARAAVVDELGDVLFAAVNVARKAGVDPELALRGTLAKFRRRFGHIEAHLGAGLADAPLDEMERLWREAADREQSD